MYDRKLMKRLFWTILFLISASIVTMMVGCAGLHKEKEVHTYNVDSLPNSEYSIYIIDSCEYIVFHNGNATWGSHKGNCKNPIHSR
jgi:hypothetical protein